MVILRCLKCLYLNWFKSYGTKCKKCKNSKNTKLSKLVNSCKNIFKYFQAFLWIHQWKTEIQRPRISHFKAFGMRNLQYEIETCHKIHNKGTISRWLIQVTIFLSGTDFIFEEQQEAWSLQDKKHPEN